MRLPLLAAVAVWQLSGAMQAAAQSSAADSESRVSPPLADNGVPIERLIATVAKKSGKKFVVDPRVRANVVLVGEEAADITYPQFLTVLEVYGFVAIDDGTLVRVLPDAAMRSQPIPTITSRDSRAASECVTELVSLKYIPAMQLVPILRPMLPQYAHLVAVPAANTLIISDRFANLRRIEALARSLDTPDSKMPPSKEPER
jgi:general secretion pathway protein D